MGRRRKSLKVRKEKETRNKDSAWKKKKE